MTAFLANLPPKDDFRVLVKESLNEICEGSPSQLEPLGLLALQPAHLISKETSFKDRLLRFIQDRSEQELASEKKRLLEERFWHNVSVIEYAEKYGFPDRHPVNRLLRSATKDLAGKLYEQEVQRRAEQRALLHSQIPASPYTQLIAVDALVEQAVDYLARPDAPHVVCISGLGGIGKTSIADKVTRNLIDLNLYHDAFWMRVDGFLDLTTLQTLLTDSARKLGGIHWVHQHHSSRWDTIQRQLRKRPYLIIIDNVEEEREFDGLIAFVKDVIGPSKVLMTSRVYSTQFSENDFLKIGVDELSKAAANEIMQHYAQEKGGETLATIITPHQDAIFNKLGGNPYALKLFISMLNAGVAIESALESLPTWQHKDTYRIYTRIYQRLWDEVLTPVAKRVLRVMPTFAEQSATQQQIREYSEIEDPLLSNAIGELTQFSLLEKRGNQTVTQYGIHRLTNTFLLSEIFKWPSYAALQADSSAQKDLIRSLEHILELWQLRIDESEDTHSDALEHLRAASELGIVHAELAESVIQLIKRSFSQIWHASQMQKWHALLMQAVALSTEPASKAELLRQTAYYLREQGQLQKSAETFQECWAELSKLPEGFTHGACLIGWGETLRQQDQKALAILKLEQAVAIATTLSSDALLGPAEANLALVLAEIGQEEKGIKYFERALARFEKAQDVDQCIVVANNIAGTYFQMGQYELARNSYEAVLPFGKQPYSAKRSEFWLTYAQAHLDYIDDNLAKAKETLSSVIENEPMLREHADLYEIFQNTVVDISKLMTEGASLVKD